jgi:hypothetical protein
MIMNLQCTYLHLAIVSPPPKPVIKSTANRLPKAANDNGPVWPLIPFPVNWYAWN